MAKELMILVSIEYFYVPEECDCSICSCCEDLILSDNYRLHAYTTTSKYKNLDPIDFVICKSCKEIIEDGDN